jgi:hypothetical protein
MSAFIVDEITMHRVVGHILDNATSFCGTYTSGTKAGNEIGAILYTLNTESVNYRYREEGKAPEYAYKKIPTSRVQAYKSIGCLLYQCSEGDFEETAAYKELEAIHNTLAHKIVSNLDAYDRADWG